MGDHGLLLIVIPGQPLEDPVQLAQDQCGAVDNEDADQKTVIGVYTAEKRFQDQPHKIGCIGYCRMQADFKKNSVEKIVHEGYLL